LAKLGLNWLKWAEYCRLRPSTKHQAPSLKRVRQYVTLTQDVGVRHYATLTAIHG